MERSFGKEVQALELGDGETFHGEGILAVTKALLQSGVSYVGGYQGAPVSHLVDVMVEAEDLLAKLGVHVETCTNEASAAAMLGASINYKLRGAVTWKSIVGTNVAADALSNLASPGVIGGALIIIGEDYGEGASIIQERSYAYAMKSSMWLLDPRPDLATIVRCVEKGFELSEATHAPVMLELRIRACHVTGSFAAKNNRRGRYSGLDRIAEPVKPDYGRISHPPSTYMHERLKIDERLPAAQAFIRAEKLNEVIPGDLDEIGIIVLGGLTTGVLLGLADLYGASRVPIYVLNVAYPLVPEEVRAFCAGKRAVLVVEEGHPDYVEQAINTELRRADIATRVLGKGVLPQAGEYNTEVLLRGLSAFLAETRPSGVDADALTERVRQMVGHRPAAMAAVGDLPARPPGFCTGCPERPVFSAIKLVQREIGPTHISADIGCHSFATLAPFGLGHSILGYGMSLASSAALGPNMAKRPIAIMGDGGFWHNGLVSGVASNLFNKGDAVLIIMQNGYTSATGQQYMPSSPTGRDGTAPGMDIETTLRALGVKWLRTVRSYSVAKMAKTLTQAMRSAERGLKVIIADGECQLVRQRRVRAEDADKLKRGERVVRTKFGVDDAICTGDHSCIRLSGCPSLTVKPNPDPLRRDPVATVIESCVGCGLCGEVAHAAVLCPSFYRAELVRNPSWWDRKLYAMRQAVLEWLGRGRATGSPPPARSETRTARTSAQAFTPFPSPRPHEPRARESARPVTLLIAALGGEGGGVLTDWIVAAASKLGFAVQSTSIPGVAQRTGATTYYVEILPVETAPGGKRPVLALTPGIGDVDVVLASELMEAARTVGNGFVTPDRTTVIASTHRSYAIAEKMAMGDGRYDESRLRGAIETHANAALLLDMQALSRDAGAMINAVMLGALAASGRLPIPAEAFAAAIRAEGKGAEANLRGFSAGLQAAQHARAEAEKPAETTALDPLAGELAAAFPLAAETIAAGVRRLADYQDAAYAKLYIARIARIAAADAAAKAGGRLMAETARHLALRMSFEDVIRVAGEKIDPERIAGIEQDIAAAPGQPVKIYEFLKPGVDEISQVLPPWLARRLLAAAARHAWLGRLHLGMQIQSTSVLGYLRLALLARLKGWRPHSFRYQEEQAAIESWLALIAEAAQHSAELALEVAECARLIKGYGDTHKRGVGNYRTIETRVIRPVLTGAIPPRTGIDAIASARTAALVDPDGEGLARCLAEIERPAYGIAAE
jgi:indolepyruvate ferredoxin oxidoreductase alpha subunit